MIPASALFGYRQVIAAAVGGGGRFVSNSEGFDRVQVERGLVLPARLSGNGDASAAKRLVELSVQDNLREIAVVDAMGHRRPVYRELLIYCWLLAYEISPGPNWGPAIRRWCEMLRGATVILAPGDMVTASNGAAIGEIVFAALMNRVAGELFGEPEWVAAGTAVIAGVCERQQSCGAFLQSTSSDNPETFWFHELILLHAVASFADRSRDRFAAVAAQRSAEFHLNETQPDHATAQPWGLPAFLRYAPLLADQVLHTAMTQQPNQIDGITLMLLADTLYGLRRSAVISKT